MKKEEEGSPKKGGVAYADAERVEVDLCRGVEAEGGRLRRNQRATWALILIFASPWVLH